MLDGDNTQILGLTAGGQTINVAKKSFYDFLKKIVEIATLQTSYLTIDECLKITSRRVNALEYIVVPRIEFVIKYIITELDERSKEEKFKIKKILANKRKHKENEELIKEQSANQVTENAIFTREDEEEDEDEDAKLFK
jgi:V-type H+-transporting ATPase subunit D